MSATLLPTLDMTDLSDAHRVLPQAPVLASISTWQGIYLAQYRQAPGETCEHTMQQHVLDISSLGAPIPHERWINGKYHQYNFGNGEIDLCPAQASHRACWGAPIQFLLLTIEPQFFQQVSDEAELSPCRSLIPKIKLNDPLLLQLTQALRGDLAAGCPAGAIYGETLGRSLILHLLRTCTSDASTTKILPIPATLSNKKLNQLRDYIEVHLDQALCLKELAAIAHLSPTYFCRCFKQSTGFAPHQYILRRRIARAQHLLKQNQLSIAEIALSCGFGSQSLLNRHFKRLTGTTPGVLRSSVRSQK